jgi:hypothetical protein
MATMRTFPRYSFPIILFLIANSIVLLVTFLGLLEVWIDFTLSGVRLWSFIISAIVALLYIILLLWRSNTVANLHMASQVTRMEHDIELNSFWWGSLIYLVLTLLLGIIHFKYTGLVDDFDPSVNPERVARLMIVVFGYLAFAMIWIGKTFFDGILAQGIEERRLLMAETR